MHIDRQTPVNLLDFVDKFPHYFIGCNAPLERIGGSVLAHDHYQGGGFGGCTISLVKTNGIDEFKEFTYKTYLKATGYKAEFYDTEISDGIIVEKL